MLLGATASERKALRSPSRAPGSRKRGGEERGEEGAEVTLVLHPAHTESAARC